MLVLVIHCSPHVPGDLNMSYVNGALSNSACNFIPPCPPPWRICTCIKIISLHLKYNICWMQSRFVVLSSFEPLCQIAGGLRDLLETAFPTSVPGPTFCNSVVKGKESILWKNLLEVKSLKVIDFYRKYFKPIYYLSLLFAFYGLGIMLQYSLA